MWLMASFVVDSLYMVVFILRFFLSKMLLAFILPVNVILLSKSFILMESALRWSFVPDKIVDMETGKERPRKAP